MSGTFLLACAGILSEMALKAEVHVYLYNRRRSRCVAESKPPVRCIKYVTLWIRIIEAPSNHTATHEACSTNSNMDGQLQSQVTCL